MLVYTPFARINGTPILILILEWTNMWNAMVLSDHLNVVIPLAVTFAKAHVLARVGWLKNKEGFIDLSCHGFHEQNKQCCYYNHLFLYFFHVI